MSEPSAAEPALALPSGIVKLAIVCVIGAATFLPNALIQNLIAEREGRQKEVQQEFARTWGPSQQASAPLLIVPYESAGQRRYAAIAPTQLDISADLAPQERQRGLLHATVYDAALTIEGRFVVPDESRLNAATGASDAHFLWTEGFIAFGATNLAGLRSDDRVAVDGASTPWRSCAEVIGSEARCGGPQWVFARIGRDFSVGDRSVAFNASLTLRGTEAFSLMQLAKDLNVTIRSPWRTPSFGGDDLPSTSSVASEGFTAQWKVAEIGPPRITILGEYINPSTMRGRTIGVDLIEATPIYRTISRAAKYHVLFLALSFAAFLFFELLSGVRIHVLQYGLLAASISLFQLLLLAMTESMGYGGGYVVSAALVLAQSSLYAGAVTKRFWPAAVFAALLAGLFGVIYVLLGMETYALVLGALTLFAAVSALMVLTQMVDWTRLSVGRRAA